MLWVRVAEALRQVGHGVHFSYQYWEKKPQALEELESLGAVGHYREDPLNADLWKRITKRWHRHQLRSAYPGFTKSHWMLSLVMETAPDLVVMNLVNAYCIADYAIPLQCLKEQGIPYYIICHLEDDAHLLFPQHRVRLKEIYSNARGVAFGAEQGAATVSRQLALTLHDVEIMQNPPQSSQQFLPWPDREDGLYMACIGRLDALAKGQDRLLDALRRSDWENRNWHLTLYGKGPDEQYLRDLCDLYHLTEKVTFAGFEKNVDAIWASHHLCLQPSPKEGTPMTVVEAMYAGRPCLVSDRGRMPELIQDEISGWVVPRSVDALQRALDTAWHQRDRLMAMGENGHTFITSYWDPDYSNHMAHLLANAV